MQSVSVKTASPYVVKIGPKLLEQTGAEVKAILSAEKICVVTDDTVKALYLETVKESLEAAGFSVCVYSIPSGEASKNWEVLGRLLEFLAESGLTRSDAVLALGGGVVGDLAGFAAAVYQRGIVYVQLPTTFLAAIDSSVGGKTAVDLAAGKNLAGAFHQPKLVLCDTDTFDTLSPEIFADGAAEAVKYGVLMGEELFNQTANLQGKATPKLVAQCVEAKAHIVEQDEKDGGIRNLLNLGHTFGHAMEKESGFRLTHGHAVAMGLAMMARAAERKGFLEAEVRGKIENALLQNGLPITCDFPAEVIFKAALGDKKRRGGKLTLVVPFGLGDCRLMPVPAEEVYDWITLGKER
ncbi:MAG TPA: 3-dehydroquinate synthase [Clostridiales bacterium]|nr:3-dehydroquinate synthase [Clostridiales bacterium]